MPEIKVVITLSESAQIERLKKKLNKSKRAIMRDALYDYIKKQEFFERGYTIEYIRVKNPNQTELDLDKEK